MLNAQWWTEHILNKSEQKLYKSLEKELYDGNNKRELNAPNTNNKDTFFKIINQIIKSNNRGRDIHLKKLKIGNGCYNVIQNKNIAL